MTDFSAWVEVDLDAFAGNVARIREIVGPNVKLHLVVKADAYGHGAARIAHVAVEQRAHSVGVATIDEGVELRRAGVKLPVIILSPSLASEAVRIVENDLTPAVASAEVARAVADASLARGVVTPVHVEIDTAMGRSGIAPEHAVEFARMLSGLPTIRLAGCFTHFPSADAEHASPLVNRQLDDFLAATGAIRAARLDPGILHAANSAAILNHPKSHLDMVRPGILAYGLAPADTVTVPEGTRPVMRFVTRLVHVRELDAGHPISYGGDFVTPERMRVGTAAVGYGHGYPFALSGRGAALLHGTRVPILGRVTMDTTVFDLRAVPHARVGDEVVLFGSQGSETLRATEVAKSADTIHYEVLIGIGRRVPRVYMRIGRRVEVRTLLGTDVPLTTRLPGDGP